MRSVLFASITILSLHTVIAEATAAPGGGTRKVELISMVGTAPGPAETSADMPLVAPDSGDVGAFRVHDLSRRWVKFQMGQSLSLREEGRDGQDRFEPIRNAPVGVPTADVPSRSTIPIPAWMRGGGVFAKATARYVPGCSAINYRPSGFLRPDAEFRRQGYYALMSSIACQHGIPVGLFDAMIIRESRYQANIYSPSNAFGLTQLMPDTAAELGVDRYDIEQNLRGGARYLREQLDRFGHFHLALAAYNAGPGRVRSGVVPRIPETQAYVEDILLNWSRLSGLNRTATVQHQRDKVRAALRPKIRRIATVSTF